MELKDAKKLKVGDIVCDCRYRHIRIKEVEDVYSNGGIFRTLMLRTPTWLPDFLYDNLCDFFDWAAERFGTQELVCVDLTLEDGANCSAVRCCNLPDHKWAHPSDGELREFNDKAKRGEV